MIGCSQLLIFFTFDNIARGMFKVEAFLQQLEGQSKSNTFSFVVSFGSVYIYIYIYTDCQQEGSLPGVLGFFVFALLASVMLTPLDCLLWGSICGYFSLCVCVNGFKKFNNSLVTRCR